MNGDEDAVSSYQFSEQNLARARRAAFGDVPALRLSVVEFIKDVLIAMYEGVDALCVVVACLLRPGGVCRFGRAPAGEVFVQAEETAYEL
ncbi:hypothetical protein EEJ42_16360 [Streptomyces botrytidirepellens]|uniref:Uncharacterized protein n=1 Tax=Streptomyces botrytidirepellens TaxID=2486417 RepID=A0A3M8W7F2_9ACTN|nr:hypothetical protein EEJ42_16360 [Streptomyces botrytidirepellens]